MKPFHDASRRSNSLSRELRMSTMNTAALLDYFTGFHDVAVDTVLAGLSVNEDHIRKTNNWLDNYDTFRIYFNCHHAVEGFHHKDWYRVGQSVFKNSATAYFKLLLQVIPLSTVYLRAPDLSARSSKASRYSVIDYSRNSIRYKFEIPDLEIRNHYTIGSECWYHLGILSAIPVSQSEKNFHAVTDHEFCSMGIRHILEDCYGINKSDCSYGSEGIYLFDELIAKWIQLEQKDSEAGIFSQEYRYTDREESNAAAVLQDVKINRRTVFQAGEIYNAPYCSFRISINNVPFFQRIFSMNRLSPEYFQNQMMLTEEKYLEAEKLKIEVKKLKAALKDHFIDEESEEDQSFEEGGKNILTAREKEIVMCIRMGMTNKEISDKLCISVETVKRHISNIFKKTNSRNRIELLHSLHQLI